MPNLPEVVRHPSLVRAAVSPRAVAVTAAGVGIGLATVQSVVLAVVLGAGAWLGRMAVAVVRRSRRDRAARPKPADLDPWSVPEPWRQLVRQAVAAQAQFDQAVQEWPPGPIKDRLVWVQPRLWADVEHVGRVAHRGASLGGWNREAAAGAGRPTARDLSDQLRRAEAERRSVGQHSPDRAAALARTEEALAAQLRALRKAEEAAADAQDRLRVLVARLQDAVTALLVLGVDATGASGTESLAESIESISEEINALHDGLADASESALGSGPAAVPLSAPPPAALEAPPQTPPGPPKP